MKFDKVRLVRYMVECNQGRSRHCPWCGVVARYDLELVFFTNDLEHQGILVYNLTCHCCHGRWTNTWQYEALIEVTPVTVPESFRLEMEDADRRLRTKRYD